MSETPTEQPAKAGGFHLPVLPDGWKYHVQLLGPDGQAINVGQDWNGAVVVGVRTGLSGGGDELKTFEAESMPEGVRQSARLVRTLRELAEHEEKSRSAREALLSQIGHPVTVIDDAPSIAITGDVDGAANTNGTRGV